MTSANWGLTLPVIDASSILRAWDEYPTAQFPGFWRWIAGEVIARRWQMAFANVGEVAHKSPECAAWLRAQELSVLPVTQAIATSALAIRTQLGIEAEGYHRDGVDENDVLLIATCGEHALECMSDESLQNYLPANMRRYKIPAVCGLRGVDVAWTNLIQAIRQAGVVFDDFGRAAR